MKSWRNYHVPPCTSVSDMEKNYVTSSQTPDTTMLHVVLQITDWSQQSSRLGKTVWVNDGEGEYQSVFLVDTQFHQPHGFPVDYSNYAVEVLPENGCVEYEHFDKATKAIQYTINTMTSHMGQGELSEKYAKHVDGLQ